MRPHLKRFYDFLVSKKAGDVVTQEEILAATKWSVATFTTHVRKNFLNPFLSSVGAGRFRIRQDGSAVSEHEISHALTQVRPALLRLEEGTKLKGLHEAYELKSFMGNGAVAHVWRCTQRGSSIERAAKIMNPRPDLLNPAMIENVRKRFLREARNSQTLSHPNLVPYRDYGEISGHPFLIMDLADSSLSQTLKKGPLSVAKSIEIVGSCLRGLFHLHGFGCVHRDVKPANILQFRDRVVLGDLGIVSWSDLNPAFTSAGTITRDSIQLGSWYYMAPEQRRTPSQVTALSDVYALGVSWYEMLTLTTPDPADVAAKHFPKATENAHVEELIRRMLAHDPAARPTVPELLDQLAKAATGALSVTEVGGLSLDLGAQGVPTSTGPTIAPAE